jgi:hypothetical protein
MTDRRQRPARILVSDAEAMTAARPLPPDIEYVAHSKPNDPGLYAFHDRRTGRAERRRGSDNRRDQPSPTGPAQLPAALTARRLAQSIADELAGSKNPDDHVPDPEAGTQVFGYLHVGGLAKGVLARLHREGL